MKKISRTSKLIIKRNPERFDFSNTIIIKMSKEATEDKNLREEIKILAKR